MRKAAGMVTGAVFAGTVLFAMANNAQGVLLSSFIESYGLRGGAQGAPNAAANAGMLLAMLLAVPLAVRLGKAALYAMGMGLMALTLILGAAAPGVLWLSAAYLLMGFGFGCVDTTASSLIADLHWGPHAPRYMGLLHAIYGIGGIVAPLLIGVAMRAGLGWRAVMAGLGALAAVLMAMCLVIFHMGRDALPRTPQGTGRLTRAGLAAFRRKRGNLLLMLVTGLSCGCQATLFVWVNRILAVGYGNARLGAMGLSIFWTGIVISRIAAPMTGLSAPRYLRLGMLLSAAAVLAGYLLGSAWAVAAAVFIAGLAGGAAIPMALAEIGRRNPEQSMLALTAVLMTSAIASIVCAPLIGFIVGRAGLQAALPVSAAFAVLGAATALALREEARG